MQRWIDYILEANPGLLRINRLNKNYGDWLSHDAPTPKELLATAYFAYDARLLAEMAAAIGRDADAARYTALFEAIRAAFCAAYVQPDGRVAGETQTAYVLALHMDLLPPDLRPLAAGHLVADIERRGGHLSTGFVGVGYLCLVLTAAGHTDVAYRLLTADSFPSWGYTIKHGATTIWERWDGWTEAHGFQDPGMNSFNHYSLGSVGQWLYGAVAGIESDPAVPGFRHLLIRPHPAPDLTHAAATYESICGPIRSEWHTEDGVFRLEVSIPANTTATVAIPAAGPAGLTESGRPVAEALGVAIAGLEPGRVLLRIGSGTYRFTAADQGR